MANKTKIDKDFGEGFFKLITEQQDKDKDKDLVDLIDTLNSKNVKETKKGKKG